MLVHPPSVTGRPANGSLERIASSAPSNVTVPLSRKERERGRTKMISNKERRREIIVPDSPSLLLCRGEREGRTKMIRKGGRWSVVEWSK